MHYIQKHILDQLRATDLVHYAKLNTDEIESGHFRYHLNQLMTDGYVGQLHRGVYGLTDKGQHFVDQLTDYKVVPEKMPKVITYTLLKDGSTLVMQKKLKEPYKDLINMIGGKLHEGETAKQAAMREVYEKTQTKIVEPKLAGIFEIISSKDEKLFTHAIAYVFSADIDAASFDDMHVTKIDWNEIASHEDQAPDLMPILEKIKDASTVVFGTLQLSI